MGRSRSVLSGCCFSKVTMFRGLRFGCEWWMEDSFLLGRGAYFDLFLFSLS